MIPGAGAGGTGLTDLLEALVAEHDRIGSPLRSQLGPGRPAADVEAALQAIGLTPTDELLEVFGWHEILDEADDQARIGWCWTATPYRLPEAVRTYRQNMEIGGVTKAELEAAVLAMTPASTFTGFWRSDWLPLLYGEPETYAVECGLDGERRRTAAVWRVNWHPDADFPTAQVADSLEAFVQRLLELFRLGGYTYDATHRAIMPVDAVFEREGLRAARPWTAMTPPR